MSIPILRRTTSNYVRLFDTVKRFTLLITYSDYGMGCNDCPLRTDLALQTVCQSAYYKYDLFNRVLVETPNSIARWAPPSLSLHTQYTTYEPDCQYPDLDVLRLSRRCRACSSAQTYGARIRSTSAAWLTSQRTVSSFSSSLQRGAVRYGRLSSVLSNSGITVRLLSSMWTVRQQFGIVVAPFVWFTLLYHTNGRQSIADLDVLRLTKHMFASVL